MFLSFAETWNVKCLIATVSGVCICVNRNQPFPFWWGVIHGLLPLVLDVTVLRFVMWHWIWRRIFMINKMLTLNEHDLFIRLLWGILTTQGSTNEEENSQTWGGSKILSSHSALSRPCQILQLQSCGSCEIRCGSQVYRENRKVCVTGWLLLFITVLL